MNLSTSAPRHGNNVVDGLNALDKRYFEGEMKLMGKLASNYTTNIGMLTSASKYVSINFSDKCLYILNNKGKIEWTKITIQI